MRRSLASLLPWAVVTALTSAAGADPTPTPAPGPTAPAADAKDQAKDHAKAGTHFFDVQQYDKAAEAYQQAYLLDPDPNYLYASAQAQRLGGDCAKALLSYKAYLRTKPADESKALKNIERCEQDLKDHPPREAPTMIAPLIPTPGIPQPPAPPAVTTPAPATPWTADLTGHALVGGGAVVVIVGAVLYVGGHGTIADNNGASTYDQFAAGRGALDGARTKQTVGISAMAVGGGLILGGVLHYALHASPADHGVAAVVHPGGASLVFTRSF
jgi:tetratricopeptide (TPR) repeat protein